MMHAVSESTAVVELQILDKTSDFLTLEVVFNVTLITTSLLVHIFELFAVFLAHMSLSLL